MEWHRNPPWMARQSVKSAHQARASSQSVKPEHQARASSQRIKPEQQTKPTNKTNKQKKGQLKSRPLPKQEQQKNLNRRPKRRRLTTFNNRLKINLNPTVTTTTICSCITCNWQVLTATFSSGTWLRDSLASQIASDTCCTSHRQRLIVIIRPGAVGMTNNMHRCLWVVTYYTCLLYTSPSPRDGLLSRMPSSA